MGIRRTQVVSPEELVQAIDTIARKVKRLERLKSLDQAVGSWKDEDHPELKDGSAKWVETLRDEAEERLHRVTKR